MKSQGNVTIALELHQTNLGDSMFKDAKGNEFQAGDKFLYIEPDGKSVVIGEIWKPTCDRKTMCELWYKLLWGTNVHLPQENSLDVLTHGARIHRIFKINMVNFTEKVLGVELTDTQKVIMESFEEFSQETVATEPWESGKPVDLQKELDKTHDIQKHQPIQEPDPLKFKSLLAMPYNIRVEKGLAVYGCGISTKIGEVIHAELSSKEGFIEVTMAIHDPIVADLIKGQMVGSISIEDGKLYIKEPDPAEPDIPQHPGCAICGGAIIGDNWNESQGTVIHNECPIQEEPDDEEQPGEY